MQQTLEQHALDLGLILNDEVDPPVKALDETTLPKGEDVSGGVIHGIRLGDLTLNQAVYGYTSMYSFTFNYSPGAKHTLTEARPICYSSPEDEERVFWEAATGKTKTISKTKSFIDFPFWDQYTLFKKHYHKWVKEMNKIIPESVIGWEVCIELTKNNVLHAHGLIYSNNNYVEMCSTTARTIWAQIAKGRVCAMKDAFAAVKSEQQWKKYIKKDNNKII